MSLARKVGTINSGAMPQIANAKRGTLLFIGAHAGRRVGARGWWEIRHVFLYDPDGWNALLIVEKYLKAACRVFLYDNTGGTLTQTSTTQNITITIPLGESSQENRVLPRRYASFAGLDRKLAWYSPALV
jgi:hypothetical protein